MDGYVVIGTEIDTKQFDAQIQYIEKRMEEIEYKLKQADMGFEVGDTSKLEAEYERLGNQLTSLKLKQSEINSQGYDRLKATVSEISTGHSNVLKKIAGWGLAIFSIRTAYTGIRQIINGVLSQNEGLKNQMDTIRNSLFAAFTPIVEKIVNLIKTLMAYINYLWNGLFGKDLFKSTSKSLSSGAKSAKEIRKQLAGFDEANVLSDNSSSGGGASGGGTDLKLADVPIPDWLKWIRDFIEEHPTISKIIFGLAAFTLFGGFKIAGGLFTAIDKLLGGGAGAGATGLLGIIGTMALIAATVVICKVTYDQVKEAIQYYIDLKKYQNEVKGEVIDLSTKNMKLANSFVKSKEGTQVASDELKLYGTWIKDAIRDNTNLMESENLDADAKEQLKIENEHLVKSMEQLYEQGSIVGDSEYEYYKFLKDVFPMGIDATNENLKGVRDTFDKLDKKYKTDYEVDMKSNGEESVKNSIKKVSDAFGTLADKIKKASEEAQKRSAVLGTGVKDLVSKVFHANGGIVNLPGRGVPVDYAGERGREGIVPMDNESQMQLLGQAIAKYVNINNVINNYMDARKINSILQTSANNERLANNG